MEPDSTPAKQPQREAGHRARPIRDGWRRLRGMIGRNPVVEHTYRLVIGVLGACVVVIGLIMVPLPGPGWLVVFSGLALLGTEFHWARRLTHWTKRQLERFWVWWKAWRAERRAAASERRALRIASTAVRPVRSVRPDIDPV